MATKYEVVRFYRNSQTRKIIKRNLTEKQAQAHCSKPETEKEGVWFDGYREQK